MTIALHDHPWFNVSVILRGMYDEVMPLYRGLERATAFHEQWTRRRFRKAGDIVFRRPTAAHRLEIIKGAEPCWTLFITGPRVRQWGFWCKSGWVHWKDFTDPENKGRVCPGCGDEA